MVKEEVKFSENLRRIIKRIIDNEEEEEKGRRRNGKRKEGKNKWLDGRNYKNNEGNEDRILKGNEGRKGKGIRR